MNISRAGQSLSEYGLAIALVALVAVGALTVFAGNLATTASDMGQTMMGNQAVGGAGGGAGGGAPNPYNGLNLSGVGGLQSVTVTTQEGNEITLSHYPGGWQQAVETAGGNGTTDIMVANLIDVINQLEELGELTPEEAMSLMDLANKGHEIAQIEKLIEDGHAATSVGIAGGGIQGESFEWQGNTYTGTELADLLAADTFHGGLMGEAADLTTTSPGNVLNEFGALFYDAQNNGLLNDPAVRAVVTELANEIWLTAEATGQSVHEENDPVHSILSEIAHQDAAGICAAGGDTDTGISCGS